MNEPNIAPFEFEGNGVRVVTRADGDLWFVAADVARALGYRDAFNAIRLCADDERGTHNLSTPSGGQEMRVISEPGLYRLIFTSRVEAAERFKRWLAHDVLPTIRRTGRYEAPAAPHRELTKAEHAALNRRAHLLAQGDYARHRERLEAGALAVLAAGRPLDLAALPSPTRAAPMEIGAQRERDKELVAAFVLDCCEVDPSASAEASALYAGFLDWVRDRAGAPLTQQRFGIALSAFGFGRRRSWRGNRVERLGLRLSAVAPRLAAGRP